MGKLNTGGRCPKCGGNLYLDRDYNGWYEQCLQCAYMKDLAIVYQHKIKKIAEPISIRRAHKKENPPAR
jgi:hypothetical protein